MKSSPPPSTCDTLPPPLPNARHSSAAAKRHKYLRRIFRFRQMDFEFASWQMVYLFVAPQKVYRNFQYRKQTKNQFARDDPAFLVLLGIWLCASTIGFSLYLGLGWASFFAFLLLVVFVDCIGVGLVVATVLWFVANKYLKKPTCTDQDVEWAYAFDIHLNAFFPVLVILNVLQWILALVFSSVVQADGAFLFNLVWVVAISYYIYITFLGYTALPILKNTQILLYPILALVVFYFVSVATGLNLWEALLEFYRRRL